MFRFLAALCVVFLASTAYGQWTQSPHQPYYERFPYQTQPPAVPSYQQQRQWWEQQELRRQQRESYWQSQSQQQELERATRCQHRGAKQRWGDCFGY